LRTVSWASENCRFMFCAPGTEACFPGNPGNRAKSVIQRVVQQVAFDQHQLKFFLASNLATQLVIKGTRNQLAREHAIGESSGGPELCLVNS